jgi:putative ABC transport system permease protein
MEMLLQDLRYAVRTLWKSKSFAAVAVITLALGIGASTAIFSVIQNVLIEPFPYPDAAHMMYLSIHDTQSNEPGGRAGYSSSEFLDYAEQNHVFDHVVAASEVEVLYKQGEGTQRLYGADVTPGTFEFFGLPAIYGRIAQPADYEPGAPPVFVMRYKTWVTKFNGDLGILNRTFVLNGTARRLIGIMPPRFGWYEADVLFPLTPKPGLVTSAGFPKPWFLLGHLKPGVSISQAEADLAIIAGREAKIVPQDYPTHFTVEVRSLTDNVTGRFQSTLFTALAGVALLLLIGCGNVANLMLARAFSREKEFALRAVLGAPRTRLIRQLLIEGLFLAVGGAAVGTLIALGSLKSIVAALPQNIIPAESIIRINAPVLAFTLGVAVLTAMVFGLVPALQASRRDLNDPLRDSGKGTSGGARHNRLRDAVVVCEVALSLTLLVAAGLLMRSFIALRSEHLGFQPENVLVVRTPLPQDRYKTAMQGEKFLRPVLTRLQAVPGVIDATTSISIPPDRGFDSDLDIPGKSHPDKWNAQLQLCGNTYFSLLRIELQTGRTFSEAEVSDARRVAVVNQTFVRKYLPGENPISQRVHLIALENMTDPVRDAWFEIIGVVADAKNSGLQEPNAPEVYLPYTITASTSPVFLIRTAQAPVALLHSVQREIWATDSGVALAYSNSLEGFISERSYAGPRFSFMLMTIFGSVGLVLVTIGVYSVLAYATARRTQEIGIRMALGAEGVDVLSLVIKNGLRLVAFGAAIGVVASLALSRLVESQLFGVSARDPLTLMVAVLLLLITGIVACWIPARRASRVDPLVALRHD